MHLVIGNKNYSSWSLRPWLLLSHFELDFTETVESLRAQDLSQRLSIHSPSNRVPVLIDNESTIWDSLAICEYVNEHYLHGKAWPADISARAYARSISGEMHAGFSALRSAMPMNIRAQRRVDITAEVAKDLARIEQIFGRDRLKYSADGPWLAGEFSIADCMYAPVVSRLGTYGMTLSNDAEAYIGAVNALPAMGNWIAAALKETEIVPEDEAGEVLE